MIKEIFSLDVYEDFIRRTSGNPSGSDPHFQYDGGNL